MQGERIRKRLRFRTYLHGLNCFNLLRQIKKYFVKRYIINPILSPQRIIFKESSVVSLVKNSEKFCVR